MNPITAKGLDGKARVLSAEIVGGLRAKLRGALCLPGEPGYDQARTVWNAMIDRHPALVVRAAGANDVMAAVGFAREHGLLLAVQGWWAQHRGKRRLRGRACCSTSRR